MNGKMVFFSPPIPCQWGNYWCQVFAAEFEEYSTQAKYYIVYKNEQLHRVSASEIIIRSS